LALPLSFVLVIFWFIFEGALLGDSRAMALQAIKPMQDATTIPIEANLGGRQNSLK
jgi:hypothetical protein